MITNFIAKLKQCSLLFKLPIAIAYLIISSNKLISLKFHRSILPRSESSNITVEFKVEKLTVKFNSMIN